MRLSLALVCLFLLWHDSNNQRGYYCYKHTTTQKWVYDGKYFWKRGCRNQVAIANSHKAEIERINNTPAFHMPVETGAANEECSEQEQEDATWFVLLEYIPDCTKQLHDVKKKIRRDTLP